MRTTSRPNERHRGLSIGLSLLASLASLSGQTAALSTTCDPGNYLMLRTDNLQAREGVCLTCPRGFMCPDETPEITKPYECAIGQYSDFGASECTDCEAGWYCSTPDALPEPCPAGHYSVENSSSCTQCESGTVCQADGTYALCTVGQTCDASQNYPEAIKCPAGSKCPDGATIVPCDSGSYSTEGQGFCTMCPVGYFCPNTDHIPILCADGYYQDKTGQDSCEQCPQYKVCTDKTKPPQSCPAGEYSIRVESKTCHQCPAGVSCDGTSTPTACGTGKYSLAGMSDCIDCPAGYECPTRAADPVACSTSGTYSLAGETYCNTCPPGFYCPVYDNEPITCSAGYYSAAKADSCTICPAGSMCAAANEIPRQCPFGTVSEEGATYCTGCPAGSTCSDDGTITFCGDGQIPNQDGDTCVNCPAGMACPAKMWDKMVMCGPGYYSTDGMMHCQISPAGQYAPVTTAAPQDCDTGYYADVGMTYCLQCPPGFFCPDKTGRHNTMCKPGSFYTGDGTCEDCATGEFCPLSISGYRASGTTCPEGTYAPLGSFDCELCKPSMDCSTDGTTRATTGSSCILPANYQLGGAKECTVCPANHECPFGETIVRCPLYFYSEVGDGACKPCPDGSDCQDFSIQDEAPVTCDPGYYAHPLDFHCVACPKGHYCQNSATTEPTKCAGGTYSNEGAATCDTCPAEYYSLEGSEYCSPVPPGYKINAANDNIEVCPHTTYSRWGETTCSTCEDGYLCPEMSSEGSAWHNSCPKGSYCIGGVQTKCPAGQYGTMERGSSSDVCQDCPPGYNCQPGTADFELVPCPAGGYCPTGTAVIACPAGTFNDQLYARSISDCKTCPIGHQCGEESTDKGSVCAEGYYCPRGSGDGSYPCPAGTHGNSQTGKKDINECLPCPPGHYCEEGSGAPTPAPAGYYTPLSGMPSMDSLYLCPPKHYCPDTGMTTYKGHFCEAGYVCPAGSSSATQVECPAGTFSDRRDLHDIKHCDLCPKGYSCDTHSTSQNGRIVACPEHRYCPEGTSTATIPLCPPGTYAPFNNAKSLYDCIECLAGNYCDGSVNSGTGLATGPQTCDAGHYCPPGTMYADESPCPPGYYNDLTGSHSLNDCLHCGFNKYCPNYGQTSPTYCPSGTFNSESTSAAYCEPCEAGYSCYQPGDGTFVYPTPCQKGFYSAKGAEGCTHCPVGTYCPNEGTTDADLKNQLCPKGTLCDSTVTYTPVGGLSGTYASGIDVYPNKKYGAGGHACPLYKYCPKGTTKALDIPRGTMQELYARGSLIDAIQMPAGRYSLDQSPTDPPYVTTVCPVGHYCPKGSFTPVPCPTGYFRDNINGQDADACGLCPAGTYCDNEGTEIPTPCDAGHFCPEGSAQPVPCPRGTYYGSTGLYDSRGCTSCDAGYYCPFLGQIQVYTAIHMCDAGYYCIAGSSRPEPTDLVTGSRCPAGGYCPQATPEPVACDAGKYGPNVGARADNECIDCKPGYYCLGEDAADATSLCKEGYYCTGGTVTYTPYDDGSTTDYHNAGIAQPGYYAPEGSFEPIKCPEGTYTGDEGRGDCDSCPAGYFCDQLGTTKDTGALQRPECAVGHYCPSYDSFVTAAAAAGDPVPEYRQIPCEPGTWNPDAAATSIQFCQQCPATKACEKKAISDDSTLPLCAAGYFCKEGASSRYPDGSSTLAGPCPVGHYCIEGTEDPEPCPAGTFSNQEKAFDATFCLPCPPGYLCEGTGNSAPTSTCDAGTICNDGLTQQVCASSKSGAYCPVASHFELYCPMGYQQPNPGKGYCSECTAGNFCMTGTSVTCDMGYYCP